MIIAVLGTIVAGLVMIALRWSWGLARAARDRRTVYHWMHGNTRDEPGKSHVDTAAIAKGTRLSEPRVLDACMTESRIFRSTAAAPTRWSVWRQEPQSVYEKRGVRTLGE